MSDSGQQMRTFWELEADRIYDLMFDFQYWCFREDHMEILARELEKIYQSGKDSCDGRLKPTE